MGTAELIAVVAAVGAAASFGSAGVLQHRAARSAPPSGPLRPQLLFDLLRIGSFRWGVVLSGLGFILQISALGFGNLGLVQPILVTGVLFYLGLASLLTRQRPDLPLMGAAVLTTVGLAAFLLAASPVHSTDADHFQGGAVLPVAILLAAVFAACVLVGSIITRYKALPYALATAICYGVTAGLVRSLVTSDLAGLLGQWQLYAVIVLGPVGFLLNQNAFQAGSAGSVAVAVITVGDPVVAITVGAAWLGEPLAGGTGRLVLDGVCMAVLTAGIVLLARRAQSLGERIRGDDLPETP